MTIEPTSFNDTAALPPGNFTLPANTTIWGPIPTDAGRSLVPDIIACSVITWLIALGFVIVRFYTRAKLINVLGPSDWCIIPALLAAGGVAAGSIEQAARGAGKHAWEVDPFGIPALERAAWYNILFYSISLFLTRVSILLLYMRIFTYNWAKRVIQVALVVVIIIGCWHVASVFTACVPLEAFWNWSLLFRPDGTINTDVYCQPGDVWWANAGLHIVSDLIIMALPFPVLSALKLPRPHKVALLIVFALGFFVCVVSIVRLVVLIDITNDVPPLDATYTSAKLIFWTTVEVNAAISCACIMTFKPLIQRRFPRLLRSSSGPYGGGVSSSSRSHHHRHGRSHSLRWLSGPVGSSKRDSRQSFMSRSASFGRNHYCSQVMGGVGGDGSIDCPQSPASDCWSGSGRKRRRESSLPMVEEFEGYVLKHRGDDGFGDLEAQKQLRAGSMSTSGGGGLRGDSESEDHSRSSTSLEAGEVRTPPKAHQRLSIHVTRSVLITKTPISPVYDTSMDGHEASPTTEVRSGVINNDIDNHGQSQGGFGAIAGVGQSGVGSFAEKRL